MNRSEGSHDYTPVEGAANYHSAGGNARVLPSAPARASEGAGAVKAIAPVPFNGLLTNKLLTGLPGEDFARLLPFLEPVSLACGEDLYGFGDAIQDVYFPESVVLSHLYILADGGTAEAAMIGNEGVVGLASIFATSAPNHYTQAIIPGVALRMSAALLKQEFARGAAMQQLLLSYVGARIAQVSQRAVCNSRHTLDARLCTWLLMLHDRAGAGPLPLTHEQIAHHLGTRRAGITGAATALRDRGVINYSRGHIDIIDRPGLEQLACECYGALSQHTLTLAHA